MLPRIRCVWYVLTLPEQTHDPTLSPRGIEGSIKRNSPVKCILMFLGMLFGGYASGGIGFQLQGSNSVMRLAG